MVGRGDEAALVLDDDDRVARVGETAQHARELRGVARVEAHRGLVEHVHRARERAAERGRERHALRLAPRERARLPAERQVAEADVHEEAQPPADLVQELFRGGIVGGRRPLAEEALGLGDRQRLDLGQRAARHPEEARLGLEPRAAALGARAVAAVAREEDTHVHLVGARLEVPEEARDPVPPLRPTAAAGLARPTRPAARRRAARPTPRRPGSPRASGSARGRPGTRCRSRSGTASPRPRRRSGADRGSRGRGRSPSCGRSPCRWGTRRPGG